MLYAETLGFKPITTPVLPSRIHGMAFVNTILRDYVECPDLPDAQTALRQLPG